MKQIKLLRLTLQNFKGEASRTTAFDGGYSMIAGKNGLGKTRHFTAFLWLLTGKDQFDRKDYEIKTRIDGNEMHGVTTSVEALLSVGGQQVTLKRAIEENWVKPKGQTEVVFKGNQTECWYDGVPVSVREYEKRVEALIGDTTRFKLLSNPYFFASLEWKKQREQLMALAGEINDYDVAYKLGSEFEALLDKLSGKSLEDHKAVVASRKRQIKDELEKVQPRIEQAKHMTPAEDDWQAIENDMERVKAELAALAAEQTSVDERYSREQERQRERRFLENNRQHAIQNARNAAMQEAFNADAKKRNEYSQRENERLELSAKIAEVEAGITRASNLKTRYQLAISDAEEEVEKWKAKRDELRSEWHVVNGMFYDETAVTCAYCGQLLPADQITEKKAEFEARKAEKLKAIVESGTLHSEKIKKLEADIAKYEEEFVECEKNISQQQALKNSLRSQLNALPAVTFTPTAPKPVDEKAIPEVQEIDAQLERLNAEAYTGSDDAVRQLQARSAALTAQLTALTRRLAVREQIALCKEEVQRLVDEGRELAQALADVEAEEYTIAEFIRAKCEEVERRVNAMFKNVQFQLFDKTLDGNTFETCRILVDGVIYQSANTASQMNAGLDILRVLMRFYGAAMPVFVDGAERANKLELPPSQCILLRVTDDETLTVRNNIEY